LGRLRLWFIFASYTKAVAPDVCCDPAPARLIQATQPLPMNGESLTSSDRGKIADERADYGGGV
jgi:hypothetical protein